MQGNTSLILKNAKNFLPGMVSFLGGASPALATWKKIYDRQKKYAPVDFVEEHETWSPDYHKRFHSQSKNMWVDFDLSKEVSQKEIAQLMTYKQDFWKVLHCFSPLAVIGAYALPLSAIWFGNDTWVPSTFNQSPEQLQKWREAQDLYRYRFAPSYIQETKWFFDFHAYPFTEAQERGWDELFEKNDVRRNPDSVRTAAKMYDGFIKLEYIKRKSLRNLCRSMNMPTFPMWSRLCQGTRVRDYWQLAWNEDYMVIRDKLHENMSDAELYDYAWRRFLAPYDKNLTREQVMERVTDYHKFLGAEFMETGTAPNIIILTNYCLGYYAEPAYLEEDIEELEKNDYDHVASWGKDAFLRRLEFENGPLRDQVEAHTQRLIAERKEKQV